MSSLKINEFLLDLAVASMKHLEYKLGHFNRGNTDVWIDTCFDSGQEWARDPWSHKCSGSFSQACARAVLRPSGSRALGEAPALGGGGCGPAWHPENGVVGGHDNLRGRPRCLRTGLLACISLPTWLLELTLDLATPDFVAGGIIFQDRVPGACL